MQIRGTPASRGIAFGRISFLKRHALPSERHEVSDVKAELERFEKARTDAIAQLGNLYEASLEKVGEQNAVVFQIHQMMLDDPDYVSQINELIENEHVNSEYAVDFVSKKFADMFKSMDNDYMQGRAADVIDISRRVTELLLLNSGQLIPQKITPSQGQPVILATDDLSPSETVQLDKDSVSGIITSEGSSRSHTVIFARTMGLASVICIGPDLNPSLEGKFAIVDGGAGIVYIEPDEATIAEFTERKRTEDALRARLEQFRGKETSTLSGRKIHLYANIGSADDIANIGSADDIELAKASDAEGIGLFRSEYIYLSSPDFPSEETQFNIYKQVLEGMGGKQVVIRTLDIGADKTADYFMLKPEDNPAMGKRLITLC